MDPVSYDLNITNSHIVNNNSSGAGGGLYLVSGNVIIKNTDIMNNYAGGSGGGIFEDHTDITNLSIVGSRITGNVTESDGGGIGLSNEGYTTIRRTLIANNQSASWGAGIFTNHEFELSNSIITGNIAERVYHFIVTGILILLTQSLEKTPMAMLCLIFILNQRKMISFFK